MLDADTVRSRRGWYVDVFVVALAAIVLEISYTRIFSFKLYYYFTYLVIGLALLGLGTGGVMVAILPRLRAIAPARTIALCGALGSASVALGYFVIAETQLNAFFLLIDWREPIKLLMVSLALFTPFLAVGIVLATVFGARPEEIDRLYAADLIGAGLGCAIAVPLIAVLTPPGCVMMSGALLAFVAVRGAGGTSIRVAGAVAGLLCVLGVLLRGALPDPVTDSVKTLAMDRKGGIRPTFTAWSTVFRVDVTPSPWNPGTHIINHDGNWGSVLNAFDGDVAKLTRFDADPRSFAFQVVKPKPKVLVIGAAGGHELLASLYFDVDHVTGVELNPVTYSLLTTHFADYTGHLPENPRITLVNGEGRSFLQRQDGRFDLVWLVAPDSYAAMNAATSGAFVLSESYLYTVEMIDEALDHLSDDGGILCAQFGEIDYKAKPNRTARYASSVREALRRRGIADPAAHIAILTSPDVVYLSTVLVKKTPFTPAEIARLAAHAPAVRDSVVRFPTADPQHEASPVTKVLRLPDAELPAWFAAHAYDLRPVVDDSPFFWHFARFRDAVRTEEARRAFHVHLDIEDLTGERVLLALLGFTVVFAAIWLLLPFVAIGPVWRAIPHKAAAAGYFASLGMGFMFIEVSLIQMLTLFLGYPSYSLSVTLFGMLVFGGIGSFLSGRYRSGRTRVLLGLLAAVAVTTVGYQVVIPFAVAHGVGLALPVRVVIATLLIAPIGLTLGAFMPIGLRTVAEQSEHSREFVAWAWAVNGFLSVMSSMLSTILAMMLGFQTLMMIAVLVYAAGIASLSRIPDVARAK